MAGGAGPGPADAERPAGALDGADGSDGLGGGAAPDPGVAALVRALAAHGLTVVCAESLTAGLVSATLAGVPGASAVLRGGVVAYATDVKADVLGVDEDLLAARGPVDEDVAVAMAAGAARLVGADVGVATTGVAGPGPAYGLPAGTVVVAVATADGGRAQRLHLPGGREQVRRSCARAALDLLGRWTAQGERERRRPR